MTHNDLSSGWSLGLHGQKAASDVYANPSGASTDHPIKDVQQIQQEGGRNNYIVTKKQYNVRYPKVASFQ
jgi:hypothetical protein